MVTQFGMSEKAGPMEYGRNYSMLSSETKAQVESEVRRLLTEGYDKARTLLKSRRKELDLLAKALVEYETLDTVEIGKVLRGESLPDRQKIPRGPMTVTKPADHEEPVPPVLQPPIGDAGTPTPPVPPPPAPPAPSQREA
jgi:ATP-dependent metalloprotease